MIVKIKMLKGEDYEKTFVSVYSPESSPTG